jgi:pyruvate kinase
MAEAGTTSAVRAVAIAAGESARKRSTAGLAPDAAVRTSAARSRRGVEQLRRRALELELAFASVIKRSHPGQRDSLRNLLHYLAVRQCDIRRLQNDLAAMGVSSLGRMEAHAMASMEAVLDVLSLLCGDTGRSEGAVARQLSIRDGRDALEQNAAAVLGPLPPGNKTRIMVTMPGEAAQEPGLIRDLLRNGMSIMRINCAHDEAAVWLQMVRHLRQAERELGLKCLVSFDLGGPKLRTGPIRPGPSIVKWRPKKDASGQIVSAARVRLCNTGPTQKRAGETVICVAGALAARALPGDQVHLVDARGRKRTLQVTQSNGSDCLCEAHSTAYVTPHTPLELHRHNRLILHDAVGEVPPLAQAILLRAGDILEIFKGDEPGHPAVLDADGRVTTPARVGCSLPEVFQSVRVGQRVFLDDGRIAGVIRRAGPDGMRVQITSAVGGSAKLRDEKGINLPDTELNLPALTAKDRSDMAFVARHGDIVALSFVQRPRDIDELLAELRRHKATKLGIMLKIETRPAFSELPSLLISAMRSPKVAVMVARGDLGVEVGFDRLSEVQEEILWLCEAAHVPVVWATQVLESLAKGGMPSRAEVTDAAMGSRAECVMLNKGPYILETLQFLRNVLTRMAGHQRKKTPLLRRLQVSDLRHADEKPARPAGARKAAKRGTARRR